MKSKPKKLTLAEVWEMYRLLEDALPEDLSVLMLDAVDHVIDNIDGDILLKVLTISYPAKMLESMSGVDALLFLIKCFKANDFFSFVEFVRSAK